MEKNVLDLFLTITKTNVSKQSSFQFEELECETDENTQLGISVAVNISKNVQFGIFVPLFDVVQLKGYME